MFSPYIADLVGFICGVVGGSAFVVVWVLAMVDYGRKKPWWAE